jgi:hypothetical protein
MAFMPGSFAPMLLGDTPKPPRFREVPSMTVLEYPSGMFWHVPIKADKTKIPTK